MIATVITDQDNWSFIIHSIVTHYIRNIIFPFAHNPPFITRKLISLLLISLPTSDHILNTHPHPHPHTLFLRASHFQRGAKDLNCFLLETTLDSIRGLTLFPSLDGNGTQTLKNLHQGSKKVNWRTSRCGTWETNLTSNHEDASSIPGLPQWVKEPALPWAGV